MHYARCKWKDEGNQGSANQVKRYIERDENYGGICLIYCVYYQS